MTEASIINIPDENVHEFARNALVSAGVDEAVADATADGLWTASIRGVDSDGIRLLPHYLKELQGGRINPTPDFEFEQTAGAIGTLNADHTYGIAAGKRAMEHAIELAEDAGVGHVSVNNSSHCGSMATFGLMAARQDMIGYATTHGTANTKLPGSTQPFFGNNPICVAAPMADEDPFCFDAAMTPITFNKVKQHRDTGEPLPPGTAVDKSGIETRDPHEADQLQYIGDYKGYGFAMVGDIFNGLLSGMPVGRDISSMFDDPLSEQRKLGHYFSAIRIDAFTDPDEFKRRLQELSADIRDEPRIDEDEPIQVPGDPEKQVKADRKEVGIPIPNHDLERFDRIANNLDIHSIRE
jgi:LDH2 family malate/lactate/ureidoglycolate dehydrogenase